MQRRSDVTTRVLYTRAPDTPNAAGVRRDAERYRLIRRGQHWSVIDGSGDVLRADALDAAVDRALASQEPK